MESFDFLFLLLILLLASKILIFGAYGQIGTEVTITFREKLGNNSVIASYIRGGNEELMRSGPFEIADATNFESIENLVIQHEVGEVYLLVAMLSATAEKFPMKGWALNRNSLFHVLNLAKNKKLNKVFWPFSIAVFGPTTLNH